MNIIKKTLVMVLCFCISMNASAEGMQVIRDQEVENVIREMANPIFSVAGLEANNVKIYILNDDQVNAFVSQGMNVFINTGLITKSENPNVLKGVIAHETGHIVGGHLIRKGEQYEKAMMGAIFSYVLGAVTAVASGAPQAGGAIMASGNQMAQRMALKYSRGQEEAADQAGIKFLTKLGIPANGLLEILDYLNTQENMLFDKVNPYALTHPLSRERINYIKAAIEKLNVQDKENSKEKQQYARILAKIKAFLQEPHETLREYDENDNSFPARYARAIAYYKIPDLKKSLSILEGLIIENPDDPYLYELKGQILFENGKIVESISPYQKAEKLLPSSALIKLGLAISLIATGDEKSINEAIRNLRQVVIKEPGNSIAWRQMAIAYGKKEEIAMANYALAEEALILGKRKEAEKFANTAKEQIKNDHAILLRLNDILRKAKDKDE